MAKKVKAQLVKQKKNSAWPSIKEFLRTLWSNDANMNYALNHKWYWSVLIGIISLIITLIAPVVNALNVKGSSYVGTAASDPFYYGLFEYNEDADDTTYAIKFADGKLAGSYTFETYENYTAQKDESKPLPKPYYSYIRQDLHVLDIYVTDLAHDDKTYLELILGSNPNYGDASTEARTSMELEKYTRTSSFIFFSSDRIYSRLYANNTAVSSINGNYNHVLEAFSELGSSYTFKDILSHKLSDVDSTNLAQHKKIMDNYKAYSDKIYIDTKNEQALITLGIYAAINAGVLLLMGFVIWLMCRGKNNPNRSLKIWHGWQISAFQALTPSILALIIGFIMAQFAAMGFVLVYSFRVMYLSMKYLRPAPQTDGRR